MTEPGTLEIRADGVLSGRTGGYLKVLCDLDGVYSEDAAYRAAPNPRHIGYRRAAA
jgi:hypothetical protein